MSRSATSKVRVALAVLTLFFVCAAAIVALRGVGRTVNALDEALSIDLHQIFPEQDPFRMAAVVNPPFTSLTYGVQAFLWWDGRSVGLAWIKQMDFTHIKQIFAWEDVQPEPDRWTWNRADQMMDELERSGLKVVARLGVVPGWARMDFPPKEAVEYIDAPPDNPDDWRGYCSAVAIRYRGRIRAYQIWNEPNLAREWGNLEPDAEAYVELLRICSEAIRAADPDAILISAGLAPTGQHNAQAHRDDMYLQAMYNAGFEQYIDVVGVHAPGFSIPDYGPDDAEKDGRGRWATFRRVEDLRKIMIRNGDAARQMAILEVGYTTDPVNDIYRWYAVSEEEQARYLAEAYRYAAEHWRPWVGLMSAIYIAKPSWTPEDEEFWWSFNDPTTGRMRPVFGALAQMEKYCGDIVLPARDPVESAVAREYNPCH